MSTTREEQRLNCIMAISKAANVSLRKATLIFDSLYSVAVVFAATDKELLFRLGDLTNPPGRKP